MMRSHGWTRDLPIEKQNEYKAKYNVDDFEALYNFYIPGFNLRSTDLQAFIGLRAIDKLDKYANLRNKNFHYYLDNIKNNELDIKVSSNDFISNFAMPIVSKDKETIVKNLIENNIECRPLIAGNLGNKPFWYENFKEVFMINGNLIDNYGFYIPNHQDLTTEQLDKIIKIVDNE
jgi:CDP-6-deoxy-D-xylo-4-hexulose-3-dehydrase